MKLITFYFLLIFFVQILLKRINTLNMRNIEEDIVVKFSSNPNPNLLVKEKMDFVRNKLRSRFNFLKRQVNSKIYFYKGSFSDDDDSIINYSLNQKNSTINNTTKVEFLPNEGKFIEKIRIIKFYVNSKQGCNVDVNDTIIYENKKAKSPIDHIVLSQHDDYDTYKIDPKGVYSNDVNIDYFGFSKKIKTFSTYFTRKNNNTKSDVELEYTYQTRNLIKSFSDFRNESSYENITYNYNLLSWYFKNENDNFENQTLKIELYFDLGDAFINENTNFTLPMEKSVFQIPSQTLNRTIVKFETKSNIILTYNKTLQFEVTFPLYFENCKNYNLNLLVLLTGFMFIGFFIFIMYRIILIVLDEEKE